MTDNELLARWQGYKPHPQVHTRWYKGNPAWLGVQNTIELPDYLNDAAACDSLLDTLVEKGYEVRLEHVPTMGWWCEATKDESATGAQSDYKTMPREAVVAACLALIQEGKAND